MKHIIKVQDIQHLPETRPIIAMDNNGNLKCEKQTSLLSLTVDVSDVGWWPSGEPFIVHFTQGMNWGEWADSDDNNTILKNDEGCIYYTDYVMEWFITYDGCPTWGISANEIIDINKSYYVHYGDY